MNTVFPGFFSWALLVGLPLSNVHYSYVMRAAFYVVPVVSKSLLVGVSRISGLLLSVILSESDRWCCLFAGRKACFLALVYIFGQMTYHCRSGGLPRLNHTLFVSALVRVVF